MVRLKGLYNLKQVELWGLLHQKNRRPFPRVTYSVILCTICRVQVTHIFRSSNFCTPLMCVYVFTFFGVFVFRCVVDVCFENISAACISRSPYPNYFLSYYPQICFGLFYVCTERFRIQEHLDTSAFSTFSQSPFMLVISFLHIFDVSLPIVGQCNEWFCNLSFWIEHCKPVCPWGFTSSCILSFYEYCKPVFPWGFPSSYILSFDEHCKPVCPWGFPSSYILSFDEQHQTSKHNSASWLYRELGLPW